jgi:hypothetical protein
MLAASGYKLKKDLKAAIGQPLHYEETSLFGPEFRSTGKNFLVGPSAYQRTWFAAVTTVDAKITKVE